MAEDDFDKAFEGHDDEEDETEEAEDAEFESEDEDEDGGEVDPNDEDFSEEWSEVPLPKKEEPGEGTRKVMRFVGPVLVVLAIIGIGAGIYFSGVIGMVTEMLNSKDTEEVVEGEDSEATEDEKNPFADKDDEEPEEEVPAEPEEVEAYDETVKVMVRIKKPAELWVNGVKQGRRKTKKAQLVLTPGEHTFRAIAKRGGLEMILDIPPGPTVQVEIDVAKGILGIKEAKAKGRKGKKGKRGKRRGR